MGKRLVALSAIVAAVGLPAAYGAATFADPAGDQLDKETLIGPDITAIHVDNTATGVVTFRVTIANYQALPPKSAISVLFDLDKDGTTGDQGFEHAITHEIDPSGQPRVVFERYDASQFRLVEVPTATVTATFSAGVLTVSIPRAELQNALTFEFGLYAVVFGATERDVAGDVSPNEDLWSYELVGLPAPSLAAPRLVVTPKRPVAGRAFTVSAAVTRTDTGAAITTGSVACTARVAKARVPARGSFRGARARCVLAIPRTARGKTLTGSLTVRSVGATLTKRFTYRVG